MQCISRHTDDTYAQQFGDGRHKFYLEFRCDRPCLKGLEVCAKCAEKSTTSLQHSRKFNHGLINEPIPDQSHIYGGKWYHEGVRKWGAPPSEIIEFAIKYQKDARGEIIVEQPSYELVKPSKESTVKEMPTTVAKKRKPKVAADPLPQTDQAEKPVTKKRKPKVAAETQEEQEESVAKKRTQPKKKELETPYSTLANTTNKLVHKEVALPLYIETQLEEIDSEGYEIEYVKLALFEANGTTYFRDSKKNKLYKKVKDKGIGQYVGRWNPDTDLINTDIPDSDEE